MFRAKRTIGEGFDAIIEGEIYELDMIYASHRNPEKSRVEISGVYTNMGHVITSKQLNEDFEELD